MEEACKKQNLKAEDFDLKHHNKILDTNVIFRFSGLPNNAQLELVPATKLRTETEIILAVNLENGKRLVGNFIPGETLINVLTQLCPDCLSMEKNPVVIYMRQEIFGKKLKTVTLKSLGITGGRAMIRLLDKTPEELKVQANVAVPLPHKPVEEKPYVRKIKESTSEDQDDISSKTKTLQSKNIVNQNENKSNNNEDVNIDQDNTTYFKKGGVIDIIKLAKEKRKSTDSSSTQEKRPNILKNETNKNLLQEVNSVKNQSVVIKTCECEQDITMEVDCFGKCQENCVNFIEGQNIEDQFVFVSIYIFNTLLFKIFNIIKLLFSKDQVCLESNSDKQ